MNNGYFTKSNGTLREQLLCFGPKLSPISCGDLFSRLRMQYSIEDVPTAHYAKFSSMLFNRRKQVINVVGEAIVLKHRRRHQYRVRNAFLRHRLDSLPRGCWKVPE